MPIENDVLVQLMKSMHKLKTQLALVGRKSSPASSHMIGDFLVNLGEGLNLSIYILLKNHTRNYKAVFLRVESLVIVMSWQSLFDLRLLRVSFCRLLRFGVYPAFSLNSTSHPVQRINEE